MASERCGAGLRCAARRCAPDRSAPPSPASARERIPGTFGSRGVPRGPKVTEADLSLKKPCSWSKEWGPPQSSHREVFLSLRFPFGPLRSSLWQMVGRRLRSLQVSLPHYGPHSLRHACASRLLAAGLSLKEIGDQLGHTDPDSTRGYAKVDLVALREVADFDLGGVQ